MTLITGPEIQLMGSVGGLHQIKIQYIYTMEDGKQYRRGVILEVAPELLPETLMNSELIHRKLDLVNEYGKIK